MAIAYSCSSNIRVFPSVGRGSFDYNARNLNEYNLSGIVNRMIGAGSFVINDITGDLSESNKLKFNIEGYYFELSSLPASLANEGDVLYAGINVYTYGTDTNYRELSPFVGASDVESGMAPLDVDGNFVGIAFSTNPSDLSSATAYLPILTCEGGSLKVPDASKVIFDASKVDFSGIVVDGGFVH